MEPKNDNENTGLPAVAQPRLVRYARGRWMYASRRDSEDWYGCCKSLEEAVESAMAMAADEEWGKIYMVHGRPATKAECFDHGVEWPWYQIDPLEAFAIIPNDPSVAVGRERPSAEA